MHFMNLKASTPLESFPSSVFRCGFRQIGFSWRVSKHTTLQCRRIGFSRLDHHRGFSRLLLASNRGSFLLLCDSPLRGRLAKAISTTREKKKNTDWSQSGVSSTVNEQAANGEEMMILRSEPTSTEEHVILDRPLPSSPSG
jgi:hypothetical protein